ncbi:tetratricopeptide repeat protein [Aeribacillus alveayuensis]|uniref:Tetratricopeptide (TPR) repeat protein n=1 Tax=Aeribacillus alveayuensis TaxID=279215 RepID=A0ABT9VJM9_9BACI|nr:tetratricopeptide (TPR) repeat protein [Bacillus alveayuensis]
MKKNDGKVIPFPRLKERLIERGMEALRKKEYERALDLFEEAEKWDKDHDEIILGKAICFLELGKLHEAKAICKKMLHEDQGNYFTVLQIYLTILVQLGQYEEVQMTIEAVLEEHKVPPYQAEHFYKLLDFSRKMNKEQEENYTPPAFSFEKMIENVDEQMKYVHFLQHSSHIKHYQTIQDFLDHPDIHPVVKTMLLQILREREITKKVFITKFGKNMTVIPNELKDISEYHLVQRVFNLLEDHLASENPTLYEAVKDMWLRHLYVLYPFPPEPPNESLWAAALHQIGYELHGIEMDDDEIQALYHVDLQPLRQVQKQIKHIQEISNLQL